MDLKKAIQIQESKISDEQPRKRFWSWLRDRLAGWFGIANHENFVFQRILREDQFEALYSLMGVQTTPQAPDDLTTVTSTRKPFLVKETIDRRYREDRPEPAGIILVLENCRPKQPELLINQLVSISNKGGLDVRVKVAAVRDHETTISLLIPGLNSSVVPVGSTVYVEDNCLPQIRNISEYQSD